MTRKPASRRKGLLPAKPALEALLLALALGIAAGCSSKAGSEKSAVAPPSADLQAARRLRDEALYPEAVAAYDRALARNPREGAALQEVVSLLIRGKRLESARERAERIRKKVPDLPAAYLATALVAYADGDRKKAERFLEKGLSFPSRDPEFYLGSAHLYALLARPARGAEILEKARSRGIENADILDLLGKLDLRIPRPAAAEAALRALVNLRPDSAEAHRNRGRALLMLSRDKEAEKEFREAERLRPGEPYTLYYLGTLEMEKGNLREAAELLSRSLEKDSMNPKAHYALGQALYRLGKVEESKEEFARHQALMERLYHGSRSGMAGGDSTMLESEPLEGEEFLDAGAEAPFDPGDPPPVEAGEGAPSPGDRFFFNDVARKVGLDLRNASGSPAKDYITDSLGSGACWLDYDGDGRLDLFLVNGERTPPGAGEPPRDALYAQGADGLFHDVTASARIRDTGWGYGCAVGDVDNDGDPDLYVTNRGPNALFLNQGDGTFREVGSAAGVDDPGWSTSAAFADYDGDGSLDLVVADYVVFDLATTPRPGANDFCRFLGMPVFCGPRGLPMARNRLYHNRGDGTFQDVTDRSGFHTDRGYYSLALAWGDVDGDGDQDLYVATDSTPNILYRNNGDGTFTDIALEAGVAYNEEGREQAGMGVDLADYDNDGDLDIVVTNFSQDVNTLYRQEAPGYFSDVSFPSGFGGASLVYLGWGVGIVDLDNDGYRDIFVANGHTQPQIDHYDLGSRYRERNLLFANGGDGTFKEVGKSAGPGLALVTPSRAAAFADYDNDGDLDIVLNNIDDLPTLLRNETGNRSHWIGLRLIGTRSNRDAIGARVTLLGEKDVRMAEVHPGYSFLSSSDPRLLFGLGSGDRRTVPEIRIRWPDGLEQVVKDLAVDSYHTLREPGPPGR